MNEGKNEGRLDFEFSPKKCRSFSKSSKASKALGKNAHFSFILRTAAHQMARGCIYINLVSASLEVTREYPLSQMDVSVGKKGK